MTKKTEIKKIYAREILDSRGNPTLRTWLTLKDGSVGVAGVPSGASTGSHEALELRDKTKRYGGKGVQKAVRNVNNILNKKLKGFDAAQQRKLDELMIELDGTPNKKKLGANAILSVSLAAARAVALSKKKPLYKYLRQVYRLKYRSWRMPMPTMNIINGGRHANNGLSIQEFMIVPQHKKLHERVRIGSEVFHALKKTLDERGYSTAVGDEGGFAPEISNNEQALKFIMRSIKAAGYVPGKHVMIAMDLAASEFHKKGRYYFSSKNSAISGDQLIKKMQSWIKKYPIISLEDPLDEDDWENWAKATAKSRKDVHIVGDDLFVTNTKRIKQGIDSGVANAVLIKVNQIGTLTESIDAIRLAQKNKYAISVSHRSAETSDTFIADLSVAVNAEYIKTGSLSRSERVEKYNRLMQIEDELT